MTCWLMTMMTWSCAHSDEYAGTQAQAQASTYKHTLHEERRRSFKLWHARCSWLCDFFVLTSFAPCHAGHAAGKHLGAIEGSPVCFGRVAGPAGPFLEARAPLPIRISLLNQIHVSEWNRADCLWFLFPDTLSATVPCRQLLVGILGCTDPKEIAPDKWETTGRTFAYNHWQGVCQNMHSAVDVSCAHHASQS